MILDMDTLYRIHSNEHSRYVTVRAHQHRHRPAPTPLANAQETIDFSLTLSGNSRFILKVIHSDLFYCQLAVCCMLYDCMLITDIKAYLI